MKVPSIKGKLNRDCGIYFEDDASLFGIGEHVLRKQENQNKRVLYLLLGSNLRSAFMVNGQLISNDQRLLENRKLVEGSVDDIISQRGIMTLAQTLDIVTTGIGPKEIAEMALANHPESVKVFEHFGEFLGRALEDTIKDLAPDELILGGNIALSYPLFSQSLLDTLNRPSLQIYPTKYTTYYIFFGMSENIKQLNQYV